MASENELQIVLSLIDNASAELKKITGDIKKDTQDVAKEADKSSKSIGDGMLEARNKIRELRREMFAAVVIMTTLYMAVKEYAKYNAEANKTVEDLQKGVSMLKVIFGGLIFEYTKAARNPFLAMLGPLGSVIAGVIALTKEGDTFARASMLMDATNQIKDFKKNLEDVNILYLTGQISAQDYYNVISSNNVANYQEMQTRLALMQQVAQQENLMRNASLMNFAEDVKSRMALLKTLQDYHHTAYSTMMDFANMFITKLSTGMTTALTSIIMGTKKAGEAFKEFGIAMVTAIVEFVIQYGIQMLIAWALSKLITGWTIGQASAIAAAWLPAAIFASIATLGSADVAGAAGMATATAAGLAIGGATIKASKAFGIIGESVGTGTGKAEGGWVGLGGPEIALVGERGPEYVVPNNRLGNMGGQTSIYIEINNPVVRSDEDIDKLTEEISMRLSREAERL